MMKFHGDGAISMSRVEATTRLCCAGYWSGASYQVTGGRGKGTTLRLRIRRSKGCPASIGLLIRFDDLASLPVAALLEEQFADVVP